MSEGIHSKPKRMLALSRNKLVLAFGGTAGVVLLTGILIQLFRGQDTEAAPETGRPTASDGRAQTRPQRYLARVNKQLITRHEVAEECLARYGREVLENIINRVIIQQECARQGIKVSDADVDQEIVRIAKRFNLPVDTWLQMLKAERGLTPAQYRRDVIWPMLALKKLAGTEVEITEADLRKAFVRDYGPRVKAKMIMLDNQRRAHKVWQELEQHPEDFERLAREYSIEPNSRALGGSIPPIRRHAGNETLEKAAFELQEGDISGIVQVGLNRYVILLCEGRTEPVVTEIKDVHEELRAQIREEQVQEAVASVFQNLKNSARVDNYLTNTSTGGKIQQTSGSQTPGASGSNPASTESYPPSPTRRAPKKAAPRRVPQNPASPVPGRSR